MGFCSARLHIIFFTKTLWLLSKGIILCIQTDKLIQNYIGSRDLESLSLNSKCSISKATKLFDLLEYFLYILNSSWK